MRRLPIHPGAVWGVAREIKKAGEDLRPLLVGGAAGPAGELQAALARAGDSTALRDVSGRAPSGYDLEGASVLVYAVEGDEPAPEDEEALRRADRKGVAAVCLLVGSTRTDPVDVPHVLAADVARVPPGAPLPVAWVAERIAERAGEDGYALAARLPELRPAVCDALVRRFSTQNAVLGVAVFVPGADLPVLTLNQLRMLFRIAAAHGEEIDAERLPEVLTVIGAAVGLRGLARQLLGFVPGLGWALKGGIAYAGTRALGEAAVAYFQAGGQRRLRDVVRSRS